MEPARTKLNRRGYGPPRPRTPLTWGGAILLLGTLVAGLLGAAVLLWRFIDIDSVLQAATDTSPPAVAEVLPEVELPELTTTQPWTAYLYESERSAGFFPRLDYFSTLMGRWHNLLNSVGARVVRVTGGRGIDSLPDNALLVVPAGVCLEDDERDAIDDHVARGGHLLATWALGVRDEQCEWVGFRFLRDVTGAEAAGTVADRPPTYLMVPHGSVLAAGLPPGVRIELKTEPWMTVRAGSSVAYWSDFALNPLAAPGGGAAGVAVARSAESGSRVAWFGYRLDVAARERDQLLLERLARNAVLWAAGHVVAEVEPWPDGYRAALAVTQDVEHNFRNSRRLAERFSAIGVPVTFFVVTQLAMEQPALAELLLSAGEVGSHSVDHRQVAGRLSSTQLAGSRQARADVARWTGVPALGFRPPRELYDESTLEAWRRVGGLYLAGWNDSRVAAPEIFRIRFGPLILLPRVVDDDYAVMVQRGQSSPDSLRAELQRGLDKMRSLGGLDLLTLHTQLIDSNRRVSAVESVVRSAQKAGDVWIARALDLAEWWLRRSWLELQVRERADHSAVLSVRNTGAEPVSSVWLRVYLPEDHSTYAAPELGESIVESLYRPGELRVRLPTIDPGGSVDILLPRHPEASASQPRASID